MDLEAFLEGGGGQFGRYLATLLVLLSFTIVVSSWQGYLHAFLGFIPPHRCWIDGYDNDATSYDEAWVRDYVPGIISTTGQWIPDSCRLFSDLPGNRSSHSDPRSSRKCDRWKHDNRSFDSVIVMEWQLFCDQQWWVSLAGSVNMAGGIVGFPLMGLTADRLGRKVVLLFCLCLVAVCGCGAAFSSNIYSFMAFRFFVELAESSMNFVVYVLVIELTNIEWRVKVTVIVCVIYSLGMLALSGIVQVIRNWRILQLATSVPAVVLVAVYAWLLPESPRWLLTKNRHQEANQIIRTIVTWNKKINNNDIDADERQEAKYGTLTHENTSTKKIKLLYPNNSDCPRPLMERLRKLLKTRTLIVRTIVVAITRFLNGLVFVGLTLNSADLEKTNSTLTFFLSGAVEIPAYLLCFATLDTFGRRISLFSAFLLTTTSCCVIILVSTTISVQWLLLTLVSLTKFGSTFVSGVMMVYMAELFPTELRSTGVGIASFVSSLSNVIAPFFTLSENSVVSYLVFGLCSLIGGLLSLYLPETRNTPLPDRIEGAQ